MSLKPSIANPQRHLPASPKAQAPRARGAGNPKILNDPELKHTLNQSPEPMRSLRAQTPLPIR